MTIDQAVEAIMRGETPEEYDKRNKRIRRLADERDALIDGIFVLEVCGDCPKDAERLEKKRRRLAKVLAEIERLK